MLGLINFKDRTNAVKHSLSHLICDRHISISVAIDAIKQIDECLEHDSSGYEESKSDLIEMKKDFIEKVIKKENELLECIRSQSAYAEHLINGTQYEFILNFPTFRSRLKNLTNATVKDARRYCEPERVESWVSGYTTAIDDINQVIDQIGIGKNNE